MTTSPRLLSLVKTDPPAAAVADVIAVPTGTASASGSAGTVHSPFRLQIPHIETEQPARLFGRFVCVWCYLYRRATGHNRRNALRLSNHCAHASKARNT